MRAGMANLVDRVRALCDIDSDSYTVNYKDYWTNDQIQSRLDSNATFLVDSPLFWRPQTLTGSDVNYLIADSLYRDFEELGSGESRWVIRDSTGAVIATSGYSVDYRQGRVTFTTDQEGTNYYLTAYSYDVYAAAANVWAEKLANFSSWYDFSADGGNYKRDQVFKHAQDMLKLMHQETGQNVVANAGGDIRVAMWRRVDVNA